jgi:predicted MFS family arabinose efflux permease
MVFSTAFGTALFGFLIDKGFSIEDIALVSFGYMTISLILLFFVKNKLNPQYI